MAPYFRFHFASLVIITKSADVLLNLILSQANNFNTSFEIKPRVITICDRPVVTNIVAPCPIWPQMSLKNKLIAVTVLKTSPKINNFAKYYNGKGSVQYRDNYAPQLFF